MILNKLSLHTSMMISRPPETEYAAWIQTYVDSTSSALAAFKLDNVAKLLEQQMAVLRALLATAPADIAGYSYAPGKWTLAESLLHTADTERVFAFRLLHVARGDTRPLFGFNQDAWVPEMRAARRTLDDILNEMDSVRAATLTLVRSLDENALVKIGIASDHPISARALIWLIAGHMNHHIDLTRDRYLAGR